MGPDDEKLIEEALRLPPGARAALAGKLIESLDDAPPDADVEAAWAREIEQRVQDLERGTARGIPWSNARRTILGAG